MKSAIRFETRGLKGVFDRGLVIIEYLRQETGWKEKHGPSRYNPHLNSGGQHPQDDHRSQKDQKMELHCPHDGGRVWDSGTHRKAMP